MAAEVVDETTYESIKPVILSHVIVSFSDSKREIVIINAVGEWPTSNIAFFKSTGSSNPGFEVFAGTFFPMFGCYKKGITPIDYSSVGKGVELSENYIVKPGGTFPEVFRGTIPSIPEWIMVLLDKYLKQELELIEDHQALIKHHLNQDYEFKDFKLLRGKFSDAMRCSTDIEKLKQLKEIYDTLNLIYKCLSNYFTSEWQVHLSIDLSKSTNTGFWIQKKLESFVAMLHHTPYEIFELSPIKHIDESQLLNFLQTYIAQCDFHKVVGPTMVNQMSPNLYNSLLFYSQIIQQIIDICKKEEERKTGKRQKTGGKSKKKRKIKRKSKSRKYKN